jgi:hypothetical protein
MPSCLISLSITKWCQKKKEGTFFFFFFFLTVLCRIRYPHHRVGLSSMHMACMLYMYGHYAALCVSQQVV